MIYYQISGLLLDLLVTKGDEASQHNCTDQHREIV